MCMQFETKSGRQGLKLKVTFHLWLDTLMSAPLLLLLGWESLRVLCYVLHVRAPCSNGCNRDLEPDVTIAPPFQTKFDLCHSDLSGLLPSSIHLRGDFIINWCRYVMKIYKYCHMMKIFLNGLMKIFWATSIQIRRNLHNISPELKVTFCNCCIKPTNQRLRQQRRASNPHILGAEKCTMT